MPAVVAPVGRPRRSLGFVILVSTMIGIFSIVFGVILMSLNVSSYHQHGEAWGRSAAEIVPVFSSLPSETVDQATLHFKQGMDLYIAGDYRGAISEFSECKTMRACEYFLSEIDFFKSGFVNGNDMDQLAKSGNPDAQYLTATLLSNRFVNLTEYTSYTFPKSVLYMYAASTMVHPGALLAMGYRHLKGYGVPKRCETAALNYLEVAKPVANIYANSIPRAVELVRLNVEKDKKILSINEISLFTQVANTNSEIALAVGKRFLLGTDGFAQDYGQAHKFLTLAATKGDEPAAIALLGYMYALGLGVVTDMKIAEDFFKKGLSDGLGLNGLGYLRFKQELVEESFQLFNRSATAGSSDGMFNLASLYLTGTGTHQNFQKAIMWFTEALRRGHTPAGYALAVMHLNGIGTVKDCPTAVTLLKEVAERGGYVSSTLRAAYQYLGQDDKELAALNFLKLAEAGHQVAQENLAYLIDSGQAGADLFLINPENQHVYAQRFYELAAEQGSIASELKLGDYAFKGSGIEAELLEAHDGSVMVSHKTREVDFKEAIKRYKKAKESGQKVLNLMHANGPSWINNIVETAEFNVGYMYHFGLGVRRNLVEAGNHYRRAIPQESHGRYLLEWLVNKLVAPEYLAPVAEEPRAKSTVDSRLVAVFVLLGLLSGLLFLRFFSR